MVLKKWARARDRTDYSVMGFLIPAGPKKLISSEDLDFVLVGTIKVMSNFLCYLPHVDYTFLLLFILA